MDLEGKHRWLLVGGTACCILALLVAIYGSLIRQDPVLHRDDRTLLNPLKSVSSLSGYLEARNSGTILDLQPVRDFSFLGDLAIQRWTGVSVFHLTNLLIWLLILFVASRIFLNQTKNWRVSLGCIALLAVHPVVTNSVSWISARKHLLSCLFIITATWIVLLESRGKWSWRRTLAVVFLYALSIYSQPITLLWPLWWVVDRWLKSPEQRRTAVAGALACSPIAVSCAVLNTLYYQGQFVRQTGAEKFVDSQAGGPIALLALGRYFANLVIPKAIATGYYPGSILNLIGLLALVVFVFAAVKWLGWREASPWLLFFFLPLAMVTVRITNIFVSDTYLLTPIVGFFSLIGLAASRLDHRTARRIAVGLCLAGVAALAIISFRLAQSWRSDASLWAHACQVEPTPNALAKHAFHLTEEGRTAEAIEIALRLGAWSPEHPEYPLFLSKAVYLDRKLSLAQKLGLLESHPAEDPWFDYHLAWLLEAAGRSGEASRRMQAALRRPASFKLELPLVTAEAVYLCERADAGECLEIARPLRDRKGWDERVYSARLSSLEPKR